MRLTLGEYPYFIFSRPFKNEKLMKFYSKKECYQLVANKLGQLEDIEEKLGTNLCYIMEAMINGYYWKGIDGSIYHFPELDFIRKDTCDESPCRPNHYYWNHTGKYLEDYGITWALTKEELE